MAIDIVIPFHNGIHWLVTCLEELFKYPPAYEFNVFVVNDRSKSSQTDQLKKLNTVFKNINIIDNDSSRNGFGAACNLGASFGNSDFIIFLNTDCFLTKGVLDKLKFAVTQADDIVLACPLSNNSPDLTYPMFPGRSYLDMAELIDRATNQISDPLLLVRDACTVVGNCLIVKREFFIEVGGFSAEWGLGYGEETDLHMKAIQRKKRGVVHIGAYVFHHGGGTFNSLKDSENLRSKNHKLFMEKWGVLYKKLAKTVSNRDSLNYVSCLIDELNIKTVEVDILFYLPGLNQSIGGLNAVVALCNELVRVGIKASCALVGINSSYDVRTYLDPIYFGLLFYSTKEEFLSDIFIRPKVVFSTIFTSATVVRKYAEARGIVPIQFIQGYEGYFENGRGYIEAIESYQSIDRIVTTSDWLIKMLGKHIKDQESIVKLPLAVNKNLFFSAPNSRDIDVGVVLRSAPDKGQWIILELLRLLQDTNLKVLIFYSLDYEFLKKYYQGRFEFLRLPLSKESLAENFRRIRLFVDASLHEGFGLMPLEAALCGADLLISDSGGVADYAERCGAKIFRISADQFEIFNYICDYFKYGSSNSKELEWPNSSEITNRWVEYLNGLLPLVKDNDFNNFSEKEAIENFIFITKISFINKIEILSIKVYSRIKPYLPNRIHLALKALIYGRM